MKHHFGLLSGIVLSIIFISIKYRNKNKHRAVTGMGECYSSIIKEYCDADKIIVDLKNEENK